MPINTVTQTDKNEWLIVEGFNKYVVTFTERGWKAYMLEASETAGEKAATAYVATSLAQKYSLEVI